MAKIKMLAGVVAISALVTACSGGSSEPGEPVEISADETTTDVDSVDEAPAEVATSGDNMATKDGVSYASLTGDAASGKMVFAQCRTCHVTDPDVNRVGPSLAGIVGHPAGAIAGFNYSSANKASGLTWTEEQLYVYLEDPQRVVPKTKMIFAGIPDAQKRADIIAYLKNPD